MNRYVVAKTIKLRDETVPKHATSFNPQINRRNDDLFIRTVAGDRLDNLAHEFYKDVSLWWIIAKANGLKGVAVPPLDEPIRIPGNITNIIENFNDLNG